MKIDLGCGPTGPDHSVEEAFLGQLLIYLSLDDQRVLAQELNRVMSKDGVIQIQKFSIDTEGYIDTLKELGWVITSVKLIDTFPSEPEVYCFTLHADASITRFTKGGVFFECKKRKQ